jgi:hypothetical protein
MAAPAKANTFGCHNPDMSFRKMFGKGRSSAPTGRQCKDVDEIAF